MSNPRITAPVLLVFSCVVIGSCVSAQVPIRIMPLGDSITVGHASYTTWRYWLWSDLTDAGYSVDFVGGENTVNGGTPSNINFDQDHEGHWGWQTSQILPNTLAYATAAQPDIVLLHLGTNDLANLVDVPTVLSNLALIIADLRTVNPNVTVFLAQVIPTTHFIASGLVPSLNAQIPGLASFLSTPQSQVISVDQQTGFSAMNDTWDGIHPNDTGGLKMAERWLVAIGDYLPDLHLLLSPRRGPESAYLRHLGGIPGNDVLTVYTIDPANANGGLGSGWFGGLHIPFNDIVMQYLAQVPPFFDTLDATGSSLYSISPGGLPGLSGMTLYSVSHTIDPVGGFVTASSNPVEFTIQ